MDRRLAGFVDGEGLHERWAREDCEDSSVWECPDCGEIYSEADERPGGGCPYCEDDDDVHHN